jgi:opacity protein-like surface antigen
MTFVSRLALSLSLSAALAPASFAIAADYDPPIFEDAQEYTPVEIGSGWYLRGDVAYNAARKYRNSSASTVSFGLIDPFADLGTLAPLQNVSRSEKDTPVMGSVGFGYHLNDFIRADLNIGMFGNSKFRVSGDIPNDFGPVSGCAGTTTVVTQALDGDGNPDGGPTAVAVDGVPCAGSANGLTSNYNGMLNAYVDLGTFAGFTPYVGAGVGVLYTKNRVSISGSCSSTTSGPVQNGAGDAEITTIYDCQDTPQGSTTTASASHTDRSYELMYGLNAGVAYKVSQNTSIDLGYQYLNAPSARTYSFGSNGLETNRGIDFHQVKLGLRYDLW